MFREVMALVDAFDIAYFIKHDLEAVTKWQIPLTMTTDSCPSFDALKCSISTTEERLLIDLQTVKDANQALKVNDAAYMSSENNKTNASTK